MSSVDVFDLRTEDEFSFLSPGGLVLIVIVLWFFGTANDLPIVRGCGTDLFGWVSCSKLWITAVFAIACICILCVFSVNVFTNHSASNRYLNNLMWLFLASSGVFFMLRHGDSYKHLADWLTGGACIGRWRCAVPDLAASIIASLVSLVALVGLSAIRLRLVSRQILNDWTKIELGVLLTTYLFGSIMMSFVIFGYRG